MGRHFLLVVSAIAATSAVGCTPEARPLTWEIVPGSAALARQIVVVETSVREGTCDGAVIFQTRVDRLNLRPAATPPRLTPGPYAFVAIGANADCEWVAAGCTVVQLPSTESLTTVALLEAPRQSYCAASASCEAGVCEGGDGGPPPFDGSFPDSGTPADASAADTGAADTGPMDTGPSCTDGVLNGDELGVDCGGACTACPAWATGSWGGCNRGTESRSVTCVDPGGGSVDEALCTASRPASSRTCAWVEYKGRGATIGTRLDPHLLTRGSCSDRTTCAGCSGGLSDADCEAHCAAKLAELGTDITCAHTGCSLDCRVYSGHGFSTPGNAPIWWGHAP